MGHLPTSVPALVCLTCGLHFLCHRVPPSHTSISSSTAPLSILCHPKGCALSNVPTQQCWSCQWPGPLQPQLRQCQPCPAHSSSQCSSPQACLIIWALGWTWQPSLAQVQWDGAIFCWLGCALHSCCTHCSITGTFLSGAWSCSCSVARWELLAAGFWGRASFLCWVLAVTSVFSPLLQQRPPARLPSSARQS